MDTYKINFRSGMEMIVYLKGLVKDHGPSVTAIMKYSEGYREIWRFNINGYKIIADNYSAFDYDNTETNWVQYQFMPNLWRELLEIVVLW